MPAPTKPTRLVDGLMAHTKTSSDSKHNDGAEAVRFTDLPAEIRNKIYEHALSWPTAINLIEGKVTNQQPSARGLTQVNTSIRSECLPLYYANNIFHFDVFSYMAGWLRDLGDDSRHLRHLQFTESCSWLPKWSGNEFGQRGLYVIRRRMDPGEMFDITAIEHYDVDNPDYDEDAPDDEAYAAPTIEETREVPWHPRAHGHHSAFQDAVYVLDFLANVVSSTAASWTAPAVCEISAHVKDLVGPHLNLFDFRLPETRSVGQYQKRYRRPDVLEPEQFTLEDF